MTQEDEYALLGNLKKKLISAAKIINLNFTEDDFGWTKKKESEKKEFYLFNRDNNLFEKPYKNVKLGTGVEAVRSSAAMIFNLLGQEDIKIDNINFNRPKYETELKAIKDDKYSDHNAHLDATLTSKDGTRFLAIEAKMLEWINCPKNLSLAYLDKEMYSNDNPEKFIDFFNKYIRDKDKRDSKDRYFHKNKRYDAIQMTIHILALYNACFKGEIKPDEIYLWNVVWEYPCKDYDIEKEEAGDYIEDANDTFSKLFSNLGHSFKVEYKTFQDVRDSIDFTLDERKKYLERYDI